MVTDSRAVEDVVFSEHGIERGVRPGSLVIDHSTIDPEGARRIAGKLLAQGVEMLDAPVSGGGVAAEAGTLAIMAGGSTAAFDRAHPVLSCYAKNIVHIGPSGAALLLAERAGVDPRKVQQAMMGGFAASRMLELQGPKMIERDFQGKVESRLHFKDIHIVLDLARAFGIELPASRAAAGVLDQLQHRGGARQDSAAIFDVLNTKPPT